MAKIDKTEMKKLAREYNIALYSAKMILKGKWTLDYALSLEKPIFNQGVRWLLNAKKRKWVMAFKTFERGTVIGKVLKVRKYNNLLLVKGRLTYLEKIDTAYVYNAKIQRLIKDYIKYDPFVSDLKEKPAYKPSDRKEVDLSDVQERNPVRLTLYTGEIIEGLVNWVTDFDFELKIDRYLSILVYKHAVWEVVKKDFHQFKQPIRKQFSRKTFQKKKSFQKRRPYSTPPGGFGPRGFGPTGGSFTS